LTGQVHGLRERAEQLKALGSIESFQILVSIKFGDKMVECAAGQHEPTDPYRQCIKNEGEKLSRPWPDNILGGLK
jgi:hypothetical protein